MSEFIDGNIAGHVTELARLRVSSPWFGAAVLLADLALSGAAGVAAHQLYHGVAAEAFGFRSDPSALLIGLCAGLVYVALARANGLYRLPSLMRGATRGGTIALLVLAANVVVAGILFAIHAGAGISRGTFAFLVPVQLVCLGASRRAARAAATALGSNGILSGPPAVVVGDEGELVHLGRHALLVTYGYREVGRISFGAEQPIDDELLRSILTLSRRGPAERIVVAMGWSDERLLALRGGLRQSALPATLLPDAGVRRLVGDRVSLAIETHPLAIELQGGAVSVTTLLVKRGLDIVLASAALVFLSPLLLVTAAAIKLDSRGPAIFRQRRHGFDRRPFVIYKFRSMHVTEDGPALEQARRGDSRVTRIGRVIRRSSIDELPQLFNVLRGDMSLVGPRPHAVAHDDRYTAIVERYAARHHVKPGLTGWAQVNGARGATAAVHEMQRRIDLDLWYIDHFSIWLDLAILCRTCVEVARSDAF